MDVLAPKIDDESEPPRQSLAELGQNAERARVLLRILRDDPSDHDARRALEALGLDEEDAEYIHCFIPNDLIEDTRPELIPAEDPAWVTRLMDDAAAYARVGLLPRAVETLQTVLRIDPHNDFARAAWFELSAQLRPNRRGDETLQIQTR